MFVIRKVYDLSTIAKSVEFIPQSPLVKKVIGMHSETCPEMVMSLNNRLMVQFLAEHLGLAADQDIDAEILRMKHLLECPFNALSLQI